MPQGRELFLSAEASLAAYFNLIPGSSNLDENRTILLNPIPIPLLPDGEPAFTEASRARFAVDFPIVESRTEQYRFAIEETQDRPDPDPAIFLGFNTTAETTAAYLYPEPSMPVYTEQDGNIYGINTPGFKSNSMIDNFFNLLGSTPSVRIFSH